MDWKIFNNVTDLLTLLEKNVRKYDIIFCKSLTFSYSIFQSIATPKAKYIKFA